MNTIGFFGAKGTGKTFTLLKLVLNNPEKKFIILDIIGSFNCLINKNFDLIYDLKDLKNNNRNYILFYSKNLDDVIKKIIDFQNYNIIIDELSIFDYNNIFKNYIKLSRHLQQNFIYATQRPIEIGKKSRLIFNLTDIFFIFKFNIKYDLQYFSFLTESNKKKILNLKIPEYLIFS